MNTCPASLDRAVLPQLVVLDPDPTDPRPKVIADLDAGQFIKSVDIDVDGFVDRMRQEGISDQEIGKKVIHVTCRPQLSGQKKSGLLELGSYDRSNGHIEINAKAFKVAHANWQKSFAQRQSVQYVDPTEAANERLDETLTRTAYHEIRHDRQFHETPDMDREAIDRDVSAHLGGLVACVSLAALPIQSSLERAGFGGAAGSMVSLGLAIWTARYAYGKFANRESRLHAKYERLPSERDARSAEEEVGEERLITMRFRDDAV